VSGCLPASYKRQNNLEYFHSGLITVIRSRRVKWTGHVARMGKTINENRVLVVNPEGKIMEKTA
jgi:hypothetical protein